MATSDASKSSDELLTVIVPCFNEEHNVRAAVESIYELAPDLPVRVETLLIDDGSTDGTKDVLYRLGEEYGSRVVINEKNLGLGRSVLNTYEVIDPKSWATVLPGDNELVFASIRNFLAVRHDADVIVGYLQNPVIRTVPRRAASFLFTKTVSAIYGFNYRYLNGMKMYRVEAFRGIEVLSSGHGFNAELLAKATLRNPHLRVLEAPFVAKGRAAGRSNAFRPTSIGREMVAVVRGWRSVAGYRGHVVRSEDED